MTKYNFAYIFTFVYGRSALIAVKDDSAYNYDNPSL